jgi:uncharacterized damage-inducible protein DinB
MAHEEQFAENFIKQSRAYLQDDFLARIKFAIRDLTDVQLWWRPNECSNSIGNLMLHLAGNVRQWIVSAVGGAPDTRTRDAEFNQRIIIPKVDVAKTLDDAVNDAAAVLASLTPSSLSASRIVQGLEVSVGEAVYHVVEHFSMHTGQILYITKLVTGRDLDLYQFDEQGNAKEMWKDGSQIKGQL